MQLIRKHFSHVYPDFFPLPVWSDWKYKHKPEFFKFHPEAVSTHQKVLYNFFKQENGKMGKNVIIYLVLMCNIQCFLLFMTIKMVGGTGIM